MPIQPQQEFSQQVEHWINKTLFVVWRAWRAGFEKAQEKVYQGYWDKACDLVGIPRNTRIDDVPTEHTKAWMEALEPAYQDPHWIRPTGFELPPVPVQLPYEVAGHVYLGAITPSDDCGPQRWELVNHDDVKDLPISVDPIRVNHDAYFEKVFQKLEDQLGISIPRTQTRNEYNTKVSDLEPWYRFQVAQSIFTIGPRHRVVAIKAEVPSRLDTSRIRDQANEDKVTYSNTRHPVGTSRIVHVHAWSQEKLIEYLLILAKASLTQAA